MDLLLITIFVLALLVVVLKSLIYIVPQTEVFVVERLGQYSDTWGPGLHIKFPVLDRIAKRISTKEQILDSPESDMISKDNVTLKVDAVVYYKVVNAEMLCYGNSKPIAALATLSVTTLRNLIGTMDLDTVLSARDEINEAMQRQLDEASDPWGIKVLRCEILTITPNAEVKASMERQLKAERDRRARVLEAQGQKEADVLRAQGQKEAKILQAEADKQTKILQAEAAKEVAIREAEGHSEAVRIEAEAEARALQAISSVAISDEAMRLRQYEAAVKMADGQASKLIVPSDIQTLASGNAVFHDTALKSISTD